MNVIDFADDIFFEVPDDLRRYRLLEFLISWLKADIRDVLVGWFHEIVRPEVSHHFWVPAHKVIVTVKIPFRHLVLGRPITLA